MRLPELLERVKALRARQSATDDDGYCLVNEAALQEDWAELFRVFFVDNEEEHEDDLLFFVVFEPATPADALEVYRRGSSSRPLPKLQGNTHFNWEHTVCLNLIMQKYEFTLEVAITVRESKAAQALRVIKQIQQRVYPSPSRRAMDSKGAGDVPTYPELFWTIDNFDDVFEDTVVPVNHLLSVELVASVDSIQSAVFSGQVSHGQLANKFAHLRVSEQSQGRLWKSRAGKAKTIQFIDMNGPVYGKAQVAVSLANGEDAPDDGAAGAAAGTGISRKRRGLFGSIRKISSDALRALMSYNDEGADPAQDPRKAPLNASLTFVSARWKNLIKYVLEEPVVPALRTWINPPSPSRPAASVSRPAAKPTSPSSPSPTAAGAAAAVGSAQVPAPAAIGSAAPEAAADAPR